MVSSAALIIVLSVFNGMEDLVISNFNHFNPDFKITKCEGKSFSSDSISIQQLDNIPGIASVQEVVSDMVLIKYKDNQILTHFKGVNKCYPSIAQIDNLIYDGSFTLYEDSNSYAVLGISVAGTLQLNLNGFETLNFFYPKRLKKNFSDPSNAFNSINVMPSGVFLTNTNYDEEYVFIPIEMARELSDYQGEVTELEIFLSPSANLNEIHKKIEQIIGNQYVVKDHYEQEETLFKTMKTEKIIIFFILTLIILMAAFNIIGIVGMLIVEKKNDISILFTLGADHHFINRIFLYEGMFVSAAGGLLGMVVGFIICLLQQLFHIVKLGGGESGYIIDYYPVTMELKDFTIVFIAVMSITILSSFASLLGLKKRKNRIEKTDN